MSNDNTPTGGNGIGVEIVSSDEIKNVTTEVKRPVKIISPMFDYRQYLAEMGKGVVGVPGLSDRLRGVPHEYDADVYEAIYKSESLVFRGVNLTAHHVMQAGFLIEGGNQKNRSVIEDWSEYIGLNVLLHETVKSLLIWGNAYFEIVKSPEDTEFGIIDLKPIPPSTMYVYRTETGDVIGYIQIPKALRTVRGYTPSRLQFRLPKGPANPDIATEKKRGWKGEVRESYPGAIPFDAEEIIHIKDNATPGAEYGLSVIEPMLGSLTIYQGMRVDIGVISRRYAAPKTIWLVGNEETPARDEMLDEFKRYMDESNIGDDIVVPSFISFEVLGAGQMTMDLGPYLSLLRDDVFAGLSVPEILMGGTIKGTLASAEIQLESFTRRITVIQDLLAYICRRQIFPLVLGLDGPLTRTQWKSVPKIVFRPMLTEEERYLRAKNLFDSNIISREESRRDLKMPDAVEGHMALDDQIELVKAQPPAFGGSPTSGGTRGPSQTTGGGGDDKKKAEKPAGEVPKDQGGGVGT